MDLLSILFAIAVGAILYTTQLRLPNQRRLFEIYSQPSGWYRLKYAAVLLLLRLRRMARPKANSAGMGVASRATFEEMEKAQQLPDERQFPHAVDAVYFNGADQQHNNIIMAASRRQKGLRQCISILRLAGIGTLEHPSQPNTNFTVERDLGFANNEMKLYCEEPMKVWRLQYDGDMILCDEGYGLRQPLLPAERKGRRVKVKADLTWRALYRHFDFDTDQDLHALASAVAAEPWSRELFHSLESLHQTHIEQFGEITGSVYIDNEKRAELRLQGARDHSYGNHRLWNDLYRYGLQYIYLEDKTCLAVGCVSMPQYLSNLIIGFVCNKDGTISSLRHSNFRLSNTGQDGRLPGQFSINFWAGGRQFMLQCTVTDQSVFSMGTQSEARIFERFCDFEVNGVRGWGVSEWCYRSCEPWPAWIADEQS